MTLEIIRDMGGRITFRLMSSVAVKADATLNFKRNKWSPAPTNYSNIKAARLIALNRVWRERFRFRRP